MVPYSDRYSKTMEYRLEQGEVKEMDRQTTSLHAKRYIHPDTGAVLIRIGIDGKYHWYRSKL